MPLINMQRSTSRINYLLLIAAVILNGCATTATQPTSSNSLKPSVLHKQHMDKIANIQSFSLNGRIGVITNPKNYSARLAWQHNAENDFVDVFSPLGGKVANIVKTPDQVTLTDNKDKVVIAKDTEALTKETLGFELPLSGLSHWSLGKPSNEGIVNAVTWDENGRINSLQQNGWNIHYKDYAAYGEYFLPNKVVLKNDQITIKLVVDKWAEFK